MGEIMRYQLLTSVYCYHVYLLCSISLFFEMVFVEKNFLFILFFHFLTSGGYFFSFLFFFRENKVIWKCVPLSSRY